MIFEKWKKYEINGTKRPSSYSTLTTVTCLICSVSKWTSIYFEPLVNFGILPTVVSLLEKWGNFLGRAGEPQCSFLFTFGKWQIFCLWKGKNYSLLVPRGFYAKGFCIPLILSLLVQRKNQRNHAAARCFSRLRTSTASPKPWTSRSPAHQHFMKKYRQAKWYR